MDDAGVRQNGRIETEAEGLARMAWHFKRGGLSGKFPEWTRTKATALMVAQMAPGAEIQSVLDLGCGDLSVMEAWAGFPGLDYYHATDGTPEVLQAAATKLAGWHGEGKAPAHRAELLTFGQLAGGARPRLRWDPQLVIAFDVIYHVHDDAVAEFLAGYPFSIPSAEFVAFSWDTSGHSGVDHFPRALTFPAGWELIHSASASHTHPQQLGIFRRHL